MNTGSSATLIIAILAIGFAITKNCYKFKYSAARENGRKLWLNCGFVGLLFYLAAKIFVFITRIIANLNDFRYFGYFEDNLSSDLIPHVTTVEIFFAILFAMLYTLYINTKPGSKNRYLRKAVNKDDFSKLVFISLAQKKPLAITLESRKVYIGLVKRTDEPLDYSHVSILPLYSGFRESESLELNITNRYSATFELFRKNDNKGFSESDLITVLPVQEIISTHIFDPKIYNNLQRKRFNKGEVNAILVEDNKLKTPPSK